MTVVAGAGLDPDIFFSEGDAVAHGSSFDLTIGCIFDHNGRKVDDHFELEPGHMVQVVSAEVFKLPDTVTGHVTYKTTLTSQGIWALTVGIVDPGWNGPVSTSLLNFSSKRHSLMPGDPFLRVTFFEHPAVPADKLRTTKSVDGYRKDVQRAAASLFPPTFLNSEAIAVKAGNHVMERIQRQALGWIGLTAFVFGFGQFFADFATYKWSTPPEKEEIQVLQRELGELQDEIRVLRARPPSPPVSPTLNEQEEIRVLRRDLESLHRELMSMATKSKIEVPKTGPDKEVPSTRGDAPSTR